MKLRVLGWVVAGFVGLWLVFWVFFEVGHVHYWMHEDELAQLLEEARKVPIEPGLIFSMRFADGRLEKAEQGPVVVRGDLSGRLVVRVPFEGGQGYIYVGDPAIKSHTAPGFPHVEHWEHVHVDEGWWSYASTKY